MVETIVNPHIAKWAHLKNNQHCCGVFYPELVLWLNAERGLHRVDHNGIQDGPAQIQTDGYQCWCRDDKCHRLDGPATLYPDGAQRWYLDDVRMTQEEWAQDIRVILYNSQTQEGAEEWLKQL